MKKIIAVMAVAGAALSLAACDVDQTEEAELPEVEGGNMPEYDVSAPDVDVETGTETVEVPTLDVDVDEADDAAGEPVTGDEE
ncbi:hypothetical protein [Aurantiacibacter spongiae]|uniref:Secreted protein n=1 Tax=Aurantiacibacter spongiae TaxID=2488860 RepID=A0A3N5DQN8_9SPHN|nr:hypothetical protein [Aurantiacibacter spongiae]RPF71501.1 hypothetical protein EG799_07650 [Aurantiacibacter spongiae]